MNPQKQKNTTACPLTAMQGGGTPLKAIKESRDSQRNSIVSHFSKKLLHLQKTYEIFFPYYYFSGTAKHGTGLSLSPGTKRGDRIIYLLVIPFYATP